MKTNARTYESPLREEQVEQTRERILEATARVLAANDGTLSIPAVAREAAVSVPTVYRHFGTKEDLITSLGEHFFDKFRLADRRPPADLDELRAFLIEQAAEYAKAEPTLQALATTEAGRKARQELLPRRKQVIAEGLGPLLDGISDEDQRRVRDVYLLLTSSGGYRAGRELLAYSDEQLADMIVWVVERLARGSQGAKRTRKEMR
ncbi:MAG: TetR/AcrR family transcriptional regulator [Actinomycetota bacterium]|nr:TetR/AcrR family transcriptional regulator [Actinomycetota bacterium]